MTSPLPRAEPPTAPTLGRATWCYGAPGVARSLWLAGLASDTAEYRDVAIAAIRASVARPREGQGRPSPTFCHGTAGLLQIVLRFAVDTGLRDLAAAADSLTEELLAAHRPDSLLGYQNMEPGDALVDQPGLLDGATGVALALLSAGGQAPGSWDRMFLLA
jgi:hypothetical protein